MSRAKFSSDERKLFYDAISKIDVDKTYVSIDKDNDTLTYTGIIDGKGVPRGRPTDEELTRCLILLNLIFKYGYKAADIRIEDDFAIGGRRSDRARAVETDIIIFNQQREVEVICEVKRIQDYKGADDTSIKKQLFDPFSNIVKYNTAKYLFHLSCDVPLSLEQFPLTCIGIDTSITKTYDEWLAQGRAPHLVDIIQANEKPVIKTVYLKLSGGEKNGSLGIGVTATRCSGCRPGGCMGESGAWASR